MAGQMCHEPRVPLCLQVHVRGNDANLVIRSRSDIDVLHGAAPVSSVEGKGSYKLCAALDELTWFNEVEKASSTLSEWATTGVPHTLLRSVVYPKLVAAFTVCVDVCVH